jgi:hypothetical protein
VGSGVAQLLSVLMQTMMRPLLTLGRRHYGGTMAKNRLDWIPEVIKAPVRVLRTRARQATAGQRVLPDVILAGVQKGGTTSLFSQLRVHPNVLWAQSKGSHYFDLEYHRGLDWYRSQCPLQRTVSAAEASSGVRPLVAESSGYYFDHPLAPERCAATLPNARVIIMLRNPVDRAYSHYHDTQGKGFEPLSFEDAIDQEASRFEGIEDEFARDEHLYSLTHHRQGYLSRGIYIHHVRRWMEAMSRENVLVLRSESFYSDTPAEYARTLRFLCLPEWKPTVFKKENAGKYEPMPAKVRDRLAEFFAPYNEQLAEYTGTDFDWS